MSYEDAIDKYPLLVNMSILDLAMMRHEAIGIDEDFRQAIDAVLKYPEPKKEQSNE